MLSIDHLKPGVQKDGVITLTEDPSNDVDGTLELVASNVYQHVRPVPAGPGDLQHRH